MMIGWIWLASIAQVSASEIVGDSFFQFRVSETEVRAAAQTFIGPYDDAYSNRDRISYEPASSTTYFKSEVRKIAFGSCNFQRLSQKYFHQIHEQRPDVWVWLGDIIYADGLPARLRQREYNRVKGSAGYSQLRKSTTVVGVWDDHDYGRNDAGEEFRDKVVSQRLLLDFLDEPADSPRRTQEGIYWVYRFGPADRQVRLILLDLRYFKKDDRQSDLLGEAQWRWLENELAHGAEPALTIIASSTQFLPYERSGERWDEYPIARARLLNQVMNLPEKVIFLSGDVHYGEISRWEDDASGKALDEVTSSGLTHAGLGFKAGLNRFRIGQSVRRNNYGMITIDWGGDLPRLLYEIRSTDGKRVFQSYQTNATRQLWQLARP